MNQHRSAAHAAYDEDFYAWTQQQAKLLRAAGKLGAELPSGLDLPHLAEEIEDLGKSELRGVTSRILQILVNLITAASDPRSRAVRHWRAEAIAINTEIPDRYAPSMRRLIDLQTLWRRALKVADAKLQEHDAALSPHVRAECPYALGELIDDSFDFDAALVRISSGEAGDARA